MTTRLAELFPPEHRIENLTATTAEGVVEEMLAALDSAHSFPDGAIEEMKSAILAREREGTTAIGHGIAIPHMKKCPHVSEIRAALGRAPQGVEFASIDGEPARLFFLILIPEGMESGHVQVMKKVVKLSRDGKTINYLVNAKAFGNLEGILQEIDESD